jgi:hypothetical protein
VRALRLSLAGILAVTVPIAAHADGPVSNMGWAGSGWHAGAVGGNPTAGHVRQRNGGSMPLHWGPNGQPLGWGLYRWQGVPTYWVWVPGSTVFDYPFSDWRGPTNGWGNP